MLSLVCLLQPFWGSRAAAVPGPARPRLSGPVTRSFHRYLQPQKPSSVKWAPKLLLLLPCFIHPATPCHSGMCCSTQKCQLAGHSGCSGKTSSIDLYLPVPAAPLLSVQSPNPAPPSFRNPDFPTPSEGPVHTPGSPSALMFHSPVQNLLG